MKRKQEAFWVVLSLIATSAVSCKQSNPYVEPPAHTFSVVQVTLSTDSFSDTVRGATVLPDFFPVSKARPLLGRLFAVGDYQSVAQPAVVISHELWGRRFNAEPATIGTRVRLNGRDATVVGVMPPDFAWPQHVLVWVPQFPK